MSFLSIGKFTLAQLKTRIVLIVVDEAHVNLPSQWGNERMREDMYIAPSYLRAQVKGTTKAPFLAMTATAKVIGSNKEKSELEQIKEMCSLQFSDTVTISISQILHNHKYVILKKPPSVSGFYGANCFSFSPQKIGSLHLLMRIYLKKFVEDVKDNRKPKRAVLFVNKLEDLIDIDEFLTSELSHLTLVTDRETCPWVTNYSSIGPHTAEKIRERTQNEDSNIYLYITTSVMLFGLDIKNVDIVIMFSPFNSLNSFLQAAGRAGRRQGDGRRRKSLIYCLYNGTDIRKGTPMEQEVKDICKSATCLKDRISPFYSLSKLSLSQSKNWCCSACSMG